MITPFTSSLMLIFLDSDVVLFVGWLLLECKGASRVTLAFPLEEQVVINHRGGSLSLIRVEAPSLPLMRLDDLSYALMVAHLNACPFFHTVSPLSIACKNDVIFQSKVIYYSPASFSKINLVFSSIFRDV